MNLFVKLFCSTVFLPVISISMIIAQITLESTFDPKNDGWNIKPLYAMCITLFYIFQEACIADLTYFNLHIVTFMYLIPVTMLLRNRNRLWWCLLAITPAITISLEYYLQLYQFINFKASLIQIFLILLVCFILLKIKNMSYYLKYALGIYFTAITHIISISMNNMFSWSYVLVFFLGTTFTILAEFQRMHSERDKDERMAKLHYESIRDDLTGLLNFRAFDKEINSLSHDVQDNDTFIGVLDIDHFKKINDTYGHLNGNIILSDFSKRLRADIHYNFDPHCAVYRFGSDEFSFVISTSKPQNMIDLLQKFENYYKTHPVTISNGTKVTFSFSCGITRHLVGETYNKALERADKLVYQAKKNGRGQIVVDDYLKEKTNNNNIDH